MKSFIVLLTVLITGCSSTVHNYIPTSKNFSIPNIRAISEAGVGDYLLDKGRKTQQEVLVLPNEVDFGRYLVQAGKYPKTGQKGDTQFFRQDLSKGIQINVTALLGDMPLPTGSLKLEGRYKLCVLRPLEFDFCDSVPNLSVIKEEITSQDSFRQTLIYNGKVGNKLKIGYREFSSNTARPAFNNEVEYDISESNIIGYKGARLEILEANNTTIKYKVIKNFK